MKRVLTALLALAVLGALFPASVSAQAFVRLQPDRKSGTIDAATTTLDMTSQALGGFGSVKIQTLDSYNGTWEVQCSLDGTTFDTDNELKLTALDSSTTAYEITDEVGIWDIGNAAGCRAIRVAATAGFVATDVAVVISATQSGGAGGAGGGVGTTQYDEDTLHVSGDALSMVGVVRQDASGPLSGDGDRTVLQVSADGNLKVTGPVTIGDPGTGALAANQVAGGPAGTPGTNVQTVQGIAGSTPVRSLLTDSGGTALTLASDSTHDAAAGTGGPQLIAECDDVSTDAVDEGDAAKVRVDCTNRQVFVRHLDPCSGGAKTFHIVNMNTATTVEIANAVASQFFYICSVNLVAAAAQTIAIGEDDTDGCGSITAGLHGGATAATGWSFAANGGISLGSGMATVMKTATAARYLCVITGQATQISGTISYVSAP